MNSISTTRKKVGVTQRELAALLGWTQSRLGNYESGARTPGLDESRAIVGALNSLGADCSLDSVFPPVKVKA